MPQHLIASLSSTFKQQVSGSTWNENAAEYHCAFALFFLRTWLEQGHGQEEPCSDWLLQLLNIKWSYVTGRYGRNKGRGLDAD